MSIPELTLRRVQRLLDAFCETRVPPHAKHQVQMLHRKRGNAIVLYERRPYWRDPSQHTEMPVARFVYDPKDETWTLECADRNDRWHVYLDCSGVTDFSSLIAEVDADPTGIFWG